MAERARRAEIGAAKLDGRAADTAVLDKRIKGLRGQVADVEASEAALSVLTDRIQTAKAHEAELKELFNKAAQEELQSRLGAAKSEFGAALDSFRAAFAKICAIEGVKPVFGSTESGVWNLYALSPIQLTSNAANPMCFEGLGHNQIDAIRDALISELRAA